MIIELTHINWYRQCAPRESMRRFSMVAILFKYWDTYSEEEPQNGNGGTTESAATAASPMERTRDSEIC